MTALIHICSTRTSTLLLRPRFHCELIWSRSMPLPTTGGTQRRFPIARIGFRCYLGRPMLSGGSVMTMSLRGRKPGKGSNTSMTMVRRHMRSITVRPSTTTVRPCSCAEISSMTGRSRSSAMITQIISPMLRKIRPYLFSA